MSYADQTKVPVEKSQAEIQAMLTKAGATRFASMFEEGQAVVLFQIRNKSCKFTLPLPSKSERRFWFRERGINKRTEKDAMAAWSKVCKSRWRALALAIKAKLESVEIGLTSFEQEFLAFIVTDNGQTVGERIIPQIDAAAKEGRAPQFLLTYGDQP